MPENPGTVEILFLAFNRLEFTRLSFECLRRNTAWERVGCCVAYDDGSEDGTAEYLEAALRTLPVAAELRRTNLRSPPAIMNDYLEATEAEAFAKIDNDIALPPGWLEASLAVLDASPELELLGLAAGWTGVREGEPGWMPASHIGGVGLMRTSAFRERPRIPADGRMGFTQWQDEHDPMRGWIVPDVLAVQLDLVPAEPWASLSAGYVQRGWQREWPPYQDPTLWDWIEDENPGTP